MNQHPHQLRPATNADADAIARVLVDAFEDDPLINWLLRDDHLGDQAWYDFFRGNVDDHLANSRRLDVVEHEGALVAAALWVQPPGGQPSSFRDHLGLWHLRSWTGLARLPRLWRLVTMTEARYPRQPHYYLPLIGTASVARGRGIGRTLLTAVTDECDRDRVPAYLESSNARNLSLYERHGFELIEEMRLGRRGPSLFRMLRTPQGG